MPRSGALTPGEFQLEPAGFVVMRTPLLPFEELYAWCESLTAAGPQRDVAALEAALAADRELLRQHLRGLVERAEVREALVVASPSLEASLDVWRSAPDSERGQKAEHALVRYFERMASRPTPFGLFAGYSLGVLGPKTQLVVPPPSMLQRHTRLDMGYLFALGEALGATPAARDGLCYRPNSSLYEVGGRLHCAEARVQGGVRRFNLVAVESSEHLSWALEAARGGALPATLAAVLVQRDPDLDGEEAASFIQMLIDSQLLVSGLEPNVTGLDPTEGLCRELSQLPELAAARQTLESVQGRLQALDQGGVGQALDSYALMTAALEGLPAPLERSRLFQVDLVKPAPELALGRNVTRELQRALTALARLAPRREAEELRRFREAFAARYEEREVPLMEALDEEFGVGFDVSSASAAVPLLQGLELGVRRAGPGAWEARHAALLRRWAASTRANAEELELREEDLAELMEPSGPPALPDSMAVWATVLAENGAAVDRGDFTVHLAFASGPSCANALGRFCAQDEALRVQVQAQLRAEEAHHPEVIFAEVVHLPEGRAGNVLHRPVLRDYEIPYLGRSGAPIERQIPLTDLSVSLRGNRVVLRSRRLGREVRPRLTNAHNFDASSNPLLYRFLCQLQGAGMSSVLTWSWGPLASAPFLPRVRYGKTILARARWRLDARELSSLGGPPTSAFTALQELRGDRKLPRWLNLVEGDHQLWIDLDNILSTETFCQLVKDRREVVLEEALGGMGTLCAQGPAGHYAHELVIPFLRRPAAEASRPEAVPVVVPAPPPERAVPRRFAPGSEWLYAKLYLGSVGVDRALRELVSPLIQGLRSRGQLGTWFFLRYGDPEWHLRLRFHGAASSLYGDVLPALQEAVAPWLHDGRAWRFQLDTYEREVERYGGPTGVELAEHIFHVDSEAVLGIVEQHAGDAGSEARWRLALCGADRLLNDFHCSLEEKAALLREMSLHYAQEFRLDGAAEARLGARFRALRPELVALLAGEAAPELASGVELLRERSAQMAPWAEAVRRAERERVLGAPMKSLLSSYVHLHVNRVLRCAQREQETVLYDFLRRLYVSELARARSGRS